MANKCSIASRIDCFSDAPTTKFGEVLKGQVEERLAFYETGSNPMKNSEAMKKVRRALFLIPSGPHFTKFIDWQALDFVKAEADAQDTDMADGDAEVEAEVVPEPKKKSKKRKSEAAPVEIEVVAEVPVSAKKSKKSKKEVVEVSSRSHSRTCQINS